MASILGGNKKAYLIVHKSDVDDVDTTKVASKTDAILTAQALLGNTTVAQVAASMQKDQMSVQVMEVQYNPSSLALQANADSIPFSSMQQNVDNSVPNQNIRPPQVTLAVELLFDAMEPADAFMADKFNTNPVDIVANVATAIRGHVFTVQPQTNGLLALLMEPKTRVITFRWASMAFTGTVTEASAEYTMFSVSGRPIRSKLRLHITQTVDSKGDYKYWDDALDKAFEKGSILSLKGAGQKAGNLLNLNSF